MTFCYSCIPSCQRWRYWYVSMNGFQVPNRWSKIKRQMIKPFLIYRQTKILEYYWNRNEIRNLVIHKFHLKENTFLDHLLMTSVTTTKRLQFVQIKGTHFSFVAIEQTSLWDGQFYAPSNQYDYPVKPQKPHFHKTLNCPLKKYLPR